MGVPQLAVPHALRSVDLVAVSCSRHRPCRVPALRSGADLDVAEARRHTRELVASIRAAPCPRRSSRLDGESARRRGARGRCRVRARRRRLDPVRLDRIWPLSPASSPSPLGPPLRPALRERGEEDWGRSGVADLGEKRAVNGKKRHRRIWGRSARWVGEKKRHGVGRRSAGFFDGVVGCAVYRSRITLLATSAMGSVAYGPISSLTWVRDTYNVSCTATALIIRNGESTRVPL